MDNTEQLIAIYHTGFIACAVICAVGVLLAVLFFFMFDIRNIFLLRTGKAKQQTINEMKERNLKTGKLSSESARADSREMTNDSAGKKSRSKRITNPSPLPADSFDNNGRQTVPTGNASETVVLQDSEGMPAEGPGSVKINSDPLETVMLSASDAISVPVNTSPTFRFTVTERTVVIHTTETI